MQIVSAFKRTVDVAWPRVFNQIMSRLRVFNFDFMHLPTASCLNPNLPYLKELMGVTLGITGIVAYIMLLWGLGSVIARARGLTLEERIRFHRTMLAQLILFFIIICARPRAPAQSALTAGSKQSALRALGSADAQCTTHLAMQTRR